MDILAPCITWIPVLCDQIFRIFSPTSVVVDLPPDITIDIFSRIPAELVFKCCQLNRSFRALTSSQSFIDLHLNRGATSVIVIPCFYTSRIYGNLDNLYEHAAPLYFIDDKTKQVVQKNFSCAVSVKYSTLNFLGSYSGLILFENEEFFVIWNPITEEQVIVNKPTKCRSCGFFFDHKTGDYKVLFLNRVGLNFEFLIYSLGARSFKKSKKFCDEPWIKAPVNLNGVLHWMVCSSSLSKSIVLFDTDSENISTMARPRSKYEYGGMKENNYVHLADWGGLLSLFDCASHKNMEIWVIEGYEQKVWMKKFAISLDFLGPLHKSRRYYVQPLSLDKDELLLNWNQALFAYNLKLYTLRKLNMKGIPTHHRGDVAPAQFLSVFHINSLVSVSIGEIL